MKKSHSVKTYTVIVLVFVISIMVFGVSVSYSFFNLQVSGSADTGRNETPPFEVTTTLNDASIIDSAELALIDGADYLTKAESVSFSVTNSPSSAVSAKYTIDLVEMSLSKNLASKYFKWAIVVNGTETYTGDFVDESVSTEPSSDTEVVSDLTKTLIGEEEAITLNVGETDNLVFYIWLENDDVVDQLYLTNGDFSGKLSMSAVPTR